MTIGNRFSKSAINLIKTKPLTTRIGTSSYVGRGTYQRLEHRLYKRINNPIRAEAKWFKVMMRVKGF